MCVGPTSFWDAKQQKKRRLSMKVNRVETGRRDPSKKAMYFYRHRCYLFLFLWKRRDISAGKLAASPGPT